MNSTTETRLLPRFSRTGGREETSLLLLNIVVWLSLVTTIVLMIVCGTIIFIAYNSSVPVDKDVAVPVFISTMSSYILLILLSLVNERFSKK